MKDRTRENMVDGSIWMRGVHMFLFAIAYNVVEAMLALTAIFQFFCVLITGRANEPLLGFAKNGALYVQEVMEFVTFNSEIRPFPFTPWPSETHTGDEWLDDDQDDVEDLKTTEAAEANQVEAKIGDDEVAPSDDTDRDSGSGKH